MAPMMTMMTKRTAITLLLALVAVGPGCGKGTTQQGTLYNISISQELHCYLSDDLESVHKAVLASVKQAGYTIDEDAIDTREARVKAHTALDRPVRVESYKQGKNVTKVEVYVSGDKVAAIELLNSIEDRVK